MKYITLTIAKSIIRKAEERVKLLEASNETTKSDFVKNAIRRAKSQLTFNDEQKLQQWLNGMKVNTYNK